MEATMGGEAYKGNKVESSNDKFNRTLDQITNQESKRINLQNGTKETNKERIEQAIKDLQPLITNFLNKQKIKPQSSKEFMNSLNANQKDNPELTKKIYEGYKTYKENFDPIIQSILRKFHNVLQFNKHKKEIKDNGPQLLDAIKNGSISIVLGEESKTLSINNIKYAINNPKQSKDKQIQNLKLLNDSKYQNIIDLLKKYPKAFNKLIGEDIEEINYLNELPKNKDDWTNALQNGASELSQIFQNKDNQKKLAELTGLSQDELNDTRNFRAFLLTHQDIFDKIIKTFNYDDEIKKITKDKKTKEQVLDTSNYTFRMMERYGIDEKKRNPKQINDGGTGIFAIINYYLNNQNNPQAQAFCKEYEEKILPGLNTEFQKKRNDFNFMKINVQNIEDLIQGEFTRPEDKTKRKDFLTSLGNALNEQNKTVALEKQVMTKESIEIGNSLANVFESTSKEPKTPKEKETMRKVLRGVHFQKEVGNKMQQLMGNPKLSNFFAKHPNLRSFTLEDLAKFDGRDPAQKLLIQLVANTFVSKKALDSYQHNLIDTNKLDDVNAITEAVDHVFEDALKDESLFKDFENNETDETFEGIIDITGDEIKDPSKLLEQFNKKHHNMDKAINLYQEEYPDQIGEDREGIWENATKEHIMDKITTFSKKYEKKININLGLDTILNVKELDLNKVNPDRLPFNRNTVEANLHKNGITINQKFKEKIEEKRTKLIKKQIKNKEKYIDQEDTKLNKLVLANRITKTIQTLKDDSLKKFTKGLKVDVDNSQSIQIDENLNITLEGTYEGKPCKLYINADGEVQTSVYYDHSHEETISFNNEDQHFTLFKLPSIEEERKIGLGMVKEELSQGQNTNERNPREKVSQGLAEKTKVSLEGIEDFPRKKEVGLCLLKIKELTNIETDTLNQEDPKEAKQYQLLKDIEECLNNARDAHQVKKLLSRFDNVQTLMNNGEKSIERNSKIFKVLFNKEDMRKQKENKNFEGNAYTLLLRHFMREKGGRKQLRINDMIEFAHSFSKGNNTIQETENKMLGNSTDSQYTLYKDTDLAKKIQKYGKNQGQKKQ